MLRPTPHTKGTKKLYIKTYGCQMNVYDTQRMADALAPEGYVHVEQADGADMVILNTCHIREKAAEKIYSELGRIRLMVDKNNKNVAEGQETKPIIAVAGCVAQAEGREIMRRAPIVDMVFGPQSYHKLPEMLGKIANGQRKVLDTDFPTEDKFDSLPAANPTNIIARGVTAFLTIQEGCDKFCTFCVVPYTRGAEYSRSIARILNEAQNLVNNGVREITLLGQNVNAYHGQDDAGNAVNLAGLMTALDTIEGLARIRYTTSHPNDMDQALIDIHANQKSAMPYLHLPVQSGSNAILTAMNRRHSRESYIKVIERLRASRPDIALSGDFIIGFPGETDDDFEATLDLVRQVTYSQAYSFKYSSRPGTSAANLTNQVDDEVKTKRLAILQVLLNQQQRQFNQNTVGATLDILFERSGREDGQLIGRSPYLQPVYVDAPTEMIGQIRPVYIESLGNFALKGNLAS
ncbi:MAG: tRNA (N6-isopentenyl adenosine(37)-C2)-methylthiotransferase MiaB [Rhizobiales bacterium]|nr:tRNA (N6-isopentenyl adenosine(37)-C2)-methylthiotransferase MiaB [Hyphomicrobiales bacterium]NRB15253.1 tRNA (N6-isopentenyl adenosine(37)-C2)-methylthiotransferase MiaB [Hyphomicrobiales bacterium]